MRVRMLYEDALDIHKAPFKDGKTDWKICCQDSYQSHMLSSTFLSPASRHTLGNVQTTVECGIDTAGKHSFDHA